MADLVLIHGSTQSPAGFGPLVAALAERGHRAFTPWIRGEPTASAVEHAEVLTAQLPADLVAPVVLAHSAAGLLLPAVARRLDAVHQIWLAAAVADYPNRRSLLTELQADPQAMVNPEWLGVDPTTDPVLATYFLFHDAGLAALRHGLATLHATDLSGVYAEVPATDPARISSSYLLPRGDRALRATWMARVARERLGVEPIEVDGGHNLYVARPELVAEAIATQI
ncbi:MAG: alpha/beta hydrolase [Pseudonocardiales bacterium]|nr:alpha/beta hydrolase [Pseudonocardiales bacterium]